MRINWFSPCWAPFDGYGNSAFHMIQALESLGHDVGLLEASTLHLRGGFDSQWIADRPALTCADAIVCYSLPPDFRRFDRRLTFGFSMWENDTPPTEWIEPMSWPQEVWAPSRASAEAFQQYAPSTVQIVPLGVNAAAFPLRARKPRHETLRFLHMAATHGMWRKGADIAIAAFTEAFFDCPDVELVIHAAEGAPGSTDDPRIVYETSEIQPHNLAAYYNAFDALLYTSRGEGFGLIPLEAACTGMLVIHTGLSGMAEYEDIGTVVPCHRVDRVDGTWYEADVSLLAKRLVAVSKNYWGYMEMAERDAREVRRRFSWDRSARAIVDRLKAHGSFQLAAS